MLCVGSLHHPFSGDFPSFFFLFFSFLRLPLLFLFPGPPAYLPAQDVGSGVNFKRKGLQTLLEQVISGMVTEVVVTHRDRLARLGADLLEFIFNKVGYKLVVLGGNEGNEDEHDLASDLLEVTTLFVASYNGRRSAENRKRRREEKGSGGKKKREKIKDDDGKRDGGARRRKEKQQEEEL